LSIVLQSVSLVRGTAPLFDAVSATLDEPRIGLIGDNGSGKSSLLRLVCGLLLPDSGSVRVHGLDTRTDRRRFPGLVGMMFQNPDDQIIFPTVLEELMFSLTALGQPRAAARRRALEFLQAERLGAWSERAVTSLSQGQRQRLCLMSLDIVEPQVLLLDEPFASLDLPGQARLMRRIERSPRQILLATHMLDQVRDFPRVLWFDAGRIRADGPGAEVCRAYREDVAAREDHAQPVS
jgi:biotin transport system ATP-binding protein